MGISHDIISEFVKITNDKKEKPKEETVYATIVQASDGKYVKIDGSDLITPTETTTDIEEGERVTVLIKDHSAIITGNISSPSASANRVNGIVDIVSEKLGVFEHIVADKIDVNELNAYKATIEHLIVGKAEIEDLKATRAEIEFLDADVAHIKTLVNGNLTSDNILSFNITADKVTMADAFIKDAMVATINAAKINAGRINTNNVVIGSDDGGMLISGATQQFTDKNGKVRIQIGRDSTGDFTFVLYGEDGTGQIINQNGITASAVSDGLIVNDMINNNAAISGGKLDISSVIFEINNENDTAIHSSKIYLDEQNQSLEAAFNSLKTQVDTIVDVSIEGDLKAFTEQIQSNTAKIEMNRTGIKTLASEDAIIRKEVSDLEGNLVETANTLSSKYSSLEQNMDGFKLEVADVYAKKSTVKDLENDIATNYATTEVMNSAITQNATEIALAVTKLETQKVQVGGTNLLTGTKTLTGAALSGQIVDDKHKGCNIIHEDNNNGSGYKDVISYSGIILEPSTEYTLSFWAQGRGFITSYLYADVVESGYHHNFENRTTNKGDGSINTHLEERTWKRYAITWKTKPNISGEKGLIVGRLNAGIPNGCCYISAPKFEKGNKPTDWSESPLEYSTTTEMNSAIQQKADEINLSVSNIQNGLTNENLLVGSFDYTPDTYWYQPSNTGISSSKILYDCKVWRTDFDWGGIKVNLKYLLDRGVFEVGKPYTFSMYACTSHGTCKMGAYMHHWYQGDYVVTTQWKQFSFTFTPNQSWIDEITDTNTRRFEPYEIDGTDIRFYGACYKLERGTIATPWATNSSDVSLIKQQADSITSTVNSNYTTLDNKFNNYPTTSQMNSAITQKADSITSTVSSNYNTLNDKFNNYPTTSQMNSAITQKANEITSTVRAYKTGVANLLLNSSEGKGLNNPSSGYHDIHFYLCGDFNNIYFHETRYFCLSFTVGYTGSFINAPFHSITFQNTWETRWLLDDIQKIERVGDNAYRYYMKPLRCDRGFVTADKLTFIGEHGDGNGWFYNVMLTEGEMHPSAYTPSNNDYSNKFSEIKQTTDGITSTVSSLGNRMGTAESTITQHSNQIATKVDVNGVKSTIQQNPESVRIGFNSISDYFDLNSTRLKVGHSDGGYTRIGQDGILYQAANGSQNRYHCLMKQGWLGQISGTSWSRTITLPSEFKGKPFSVIISVTEVNAVNTHDVIKHFKATVPHDTVDYTNGTFVINMSALAYYVPGQQSASAIQTDVSWIAIC